MSERDEWAARLASERAALTLPSPEVVTPAIATMHRDNASRAGDLAGVAQWEAVLATFATPVPLCNECGTAPRHEDCGDNCRRCSNKNQCGSRDYTTIIDHDKLRSKLGRELAAAVLHECAAGWEDERR